MSDNESRLEAIGAAVSSSGGDGLLPLIEGLRAKVRRYKAMIEENKLRGISLEGSMREAEQTLATLENAAEKWGVNGLREVVTEVRQADPSTGQPVERVKDTVVEPPVSEYRQRYEAGTHCVYREEGKTKFCQRLLRTKDQKKTHLCAIHGAALEGATRKRPKKGK